ncbi:DUF4843 domain-containing protein [Chitinophaga rhizosphaerae]|uniref:DUF4843 domain-containing protein n=1 Tax=Chitinophaga rhizosphaerae TaxID=1864947 RepID=UPI000F7FBFED|nr:DUF4843 domain-containing protein [Chitinophaga rhizosphaerae]
MKRTFQYTCLLLAAAFSLGACEKSGLVEYSLPDMVYFYKDASSDARDSLSYSFAIRSATLEYDTIRIPVQIMGTARDYDRVVTWGTVDSLTTAVAGTDYEVLPSKVPAGAYTAEVPVKVLRNAAQKTTEVRLWLEIRESKDFRPGIEDSRGSSWSHPGAGRRFLVKINDFLTKPNNWDSWLKYFFGTYSQVKYAFIIQATGRAEFPWGSANGLPYGQFQYFQTVCRNALETYEAEHGTLMDEFGNPVTF